MSMAFPWRKVALSTAIGLFLVSVLLYLQSGDAMLLLLGAIVGAMLAAFFGLAWLLVVGLRRAP